MYVTICDECLGGFCWKCSKGLLKLERQKLEEYNKDKPEDEQLIGGGHCVCRHGGVEGAFEQGVRKRAEEKYKARKPNFID